MQVELPVLPDLRMEHRPPDVDAPLAIAMLLADRTRASILALLAGGPLCVCEMAAALGARENNVSNHLALLRDAGLVRAAAMRSTPGACTTSVTRRRAPTRSTRSEP